MRDNIDILQDKTVYVAAPVHTMSGYGNRSRDVVRMLIDIGIDPKIIPQKWGETPMTALDGADERDTEILDRIITSEEYEQRPDVFIQITIPNEFKPIGVEYNIGITAGIETNLCKADWIEGCNRMDLVLTSSQHSKDVFENTVYDRENKMGQPAGKLKLNTPVEILQEGIDLEVFAGESSEKTKVSSFIDDIDESFVWIFVGHWLQGQIGHDRKDIGSLIKVFCDTFKPLPQNKKPALLLKTSTGNFSDFDAHNIEHRISEIMKMSDNSNLKGDVPSVYFLNGELTDYEMNELYGHKKVKAMVSFTKGEGFGRPLLEFAMAGKPVVASGWSGQVDFLDPEYHPRLKGELNDVHPSAANDWIDSNAKWFYVDYQYASKAFIEVTQKYVSFRKKTKELVPRLRSKFSLNAMRQTFVNIVNDQLELMDVNSDNMFEEIEATDESE